MVHDAANALAPLTVSRAHFVTAKPARVSHRGWVGWLQGAWEEAELNYVLPGYARWVNCY